MTPEEAIAKLRTLPEDKQRAVLSKLSPEVRSGILQKLKAGDVKLRPGVKISGYNSAGQPMFEPEETQGPGYADALFDPVGSGGREQGLVGGTLQVGGQAAKAFLQPILHPWETAKGVGKTVVDAVAGGIPFAASQDVIGPMIQNFARDKAKGGTALAVENLGGQLLGSIEGGRAMGGATKAAGAKIAEGATAAREWWRPTSSPEVVPALEQSARNLTDAINPNPTEANQFIENVQDRMPEILDYAKRTKNPLKTRLEFAKAAQGAGTEIRDWYVKNILGPAEKEEVSVAGTGYRGKTIGEGQRATLGDVSDRLEAINKELRPDYRQRNAGMVGSKLATEAELNAEAHALRSILNRNLSRTSGLSEAEVSSVRQMYGSLRHIADATNETVTQRGLSAARAQEGSLPISKTGIIDRAAKNAMGGQGAIQDRAFQRALAEFNDQRPSNFGPLRDRFASSKRPLPQASARNPRPARQPATGPSEPPSAGTISSAEQKEFLDKVNERLAGRKKAIAEKAQKRIEEEALKSAKTQREKDLIRFNSQF